MVKFFHQVGTAVGTVDLLIHPHKHLFYLFIKLRPVCDHQHPRILHIFPYPLRQPHHGQALARPLGVPNNAAFTAGNIWLGGVNAKILIMAAGLFAPGIKYDKVVDKLKKPGLVADPA